MEFKHNLDTAVLIARKQWGKSTLIKMIISKLLNEDIVVLDSNREYKTFKNKWIPQEYTPEELDRFIRYARQFKNKLVIIDDIDLFFTGAQPTIEFKKFLINASHQRLGLICTLKRPLYVPKLLLSETIHLFLGNFMFDNDVKYLENFIESKGVLEKIERYTFLYRNADTGEEKIIKTRV
jgi:hypothetical protein